MSIICKYKHPGRQYSWLAENGDISIHQRTQARIAAALSVIRQCTIVLPLEITLTGSVGLRLKHSLTVSAVQDGVPSGLRMENGQCASCC